MFKLGPTQRQDCQLCSDKKKIHIVCNCPVWCAKDTEPWVIRFEVQGYGNHEGVWPNSLVASTWLGEIP